MRELASQYCFARCTLERGLEVLDECSASPNGTRSKARTIFQNLRRKGVLAFECRCQVLDERIKETIARFRFNPCDDLSQRRVVRRGFGVDCFAPIKENLASLVRYDRLIDSSAD